MTDQLDRMKKSFSDRYAIERELGAGGMATVYLAQDLRHERQVAIKVLRPDLAATLGPERFLREIKIAAQLQHPNVLPLLDSGEADGNLYYVMPYIEGQSLRDKLAKEGELPVGEAVRVLRDVVDALTAAHAHGVVHRDIKPENVLLSGRHALVADFGVAKAVSEATGREQLTTAGVALGTPAYMAPEQAAADPHLDHRVDIYAVGAVAYELLTGRPVFMGTTPQMVLSAHVTEAPQPVTKHRDTVPKALEAVVMRCLEKKPADRWQSADELLPQLEVLATPSGGLTPTETAPVAAHQRRPKWAWMIGAAAVVAMAVISLLVMRPLVQEETAVSVEPDTTWRMLLVADFTHAPEDSALAAGVSDAIRSNLQNVVGLEVLDRSAMMDMLARFMGIPDMPAPDSLFRLANSVGFHGMVSGSVQRMGPGFLLSASLRPTVPGPVQISLSETATDSTQLVDAVQRLGATLRERLVEEAPRLESPPFEMVVTVRSPQARRLYGDAVRAWGTDYFAVVTYLRQAIRLEPTFGEGHRRLSAALATLGIRRAERIRAIEAAYAVRDSLMPWERGMAIGMYHSTRGDREQGIAAYRRLLEDLPEFSAALNNLGSAYSGQRDYGLAERLYRTWADTTGASYEWYEYMWLGAQINLGWLGTVDSLVELIQAAGADTGTLFDVHRHRRLIAERRYIEMQALDANTSLGRAPSEYDRFRQVSQDEYTALVLGRLEEFEALASERADIHRDLEDGRGVLLQARSIARARVRFLEDSTGARSVLEDALARQPFDELELLDRPYYQMAMAFADLGDAVAAERYVERWEREVPAEYQNIDRNNVDLARGDIALAAGRPAEAIEHYRRGDVYGCVPCDLPRFARAWEALGETDSAIDTYERYIATPATGRIYADAYELANAYLQMGELYEQRGDRDNAVRYYTELIDLWREADMVLRGRLGDVRQRITRLTQEPRVP